MILTNKEKAILRMFGPKTFTVEVEKSRARDVLVELGLLEWEPAPNWMGPQYKLTAKGREEKEKIDGQNTASH